MKRRTKLLIAALPFLILYLGVSYVGAQGSRRPQLRVRGDFPGQSDTLVVFVHGLNPDAGRSILPFLKRTFPGAHILAPAFNASPFSNADPKVLAARISDAIHDKFTTHRYRRIILVGHSAGASLLRKAYVWGRGFDEDRTDAHVGVRPWTARVDRLVMLAGLTRGWSLDPPPENLTFGRRLLMRTGLFVAKVTGTGKFMRSHERGAPFVANLRIQWIRLARSQRGGSVPLVVQLLGGADDVVSGDDMRDVAVAKDFLYVALGADTGHAEVAQLEDSPDEEKEAVDERRRVLTIALTQPATVIQQIAERYEPGEDLRPVHMVFIRHGIRDFGDWTDRLGRTIKDLRPDVEIDSSKYTYFGMGPFLFFNARQHNVRELVDTYTEKLAQYPNATFSFVGHSNGTYILASALQRYHSVQLDRVVFLGSVAPRAYDWSKLAKAQQVKGVVNVVGSADWVVAIFPRMLETLGEIADAQPAGMFDIGAAGFRGFSKIPDDFGATGSRRVSKRPDDFRNIKYAEGAHSAGFGDELRNGEAIGRYVLRLSDDVALVNTVQDPSPVVDLLSRLCIMVWVLLVAMLVGIGIAIQRVVTHRIPQHQAAAVTAYVVILLIVLRTI